VRALMEAGADPNAGPARTRTALMEAARKGHATVVRRLLEAGADPDAQMEDSRNEGKTALRFALEAGHTETARLLREADAQR
jgi:ankyrin repeat protein